MSAPLTKAQRNYDRRARAANVLHVYRGYAFFSEPLQTMVVDLLTDLMHLQDRGNRKMRRNDPLDVERAFGTAREHYLAERTGGAR